jgi:serine/threonine protein kinase
MTLGFIGEGHVGQRNVIARIPLHLAAVNVWSLGVIFFYMLSGYHPFSDALSTSENANCKRFATCPVRFF